MIDARTLAENAIQADLARIKGMLAGTIKGGTMKDYCTQNNGLAHRTQTPLY